MEVLGTHLGIPTVRGGCGGAILQGGMTKAQRANSEKAAERAVLAAVRRLKAAAGSEPVREPEPGFSSLLEAISHVIPLEPCENFQVGHCCFCHEPGLSLCVNRDYFLCSCCGVAGGLPEWLALAPGLDLKPAECAKWHAFCLAGVERCLEGLARGVGSCVVLPGALPSLAAESVPAPGGSPPAKPARARRSRAGSPPVG